MNFESAIKTINEDLCNTFYGVYLQDQWGIKVGYDTVPGYLAIMRKQLADWQLANDCTGELCDLSRDQPVTVVEYATSDTSGCLLNPPMSACNHGWWPYNVRETLVASFYR